MLEIELKLRIPADALDKLSKSIFIQSHSSSGPVQMQLMTTYYDTPKLTLYRAGIALRIREMAGKFIQTVKLDVSREEEGIHRRYEWDIELDQGVPDYERFTDEKVRQLLLENNIEEGLTPIFVTDFQRTAWILNFDEGAKVELAVDIGMIRAGDKAEPIREMELELIAGDAKKIYEIAEYLSGFIPVEIENRSKAERGYRLRGNDG